jgi:glutamate N-acetyltransferase / amino-acid N-acetyltransferase
MGSMMLPQGFRSGSAAAGLKSTGALDITLIENLGPNFHAAAVFTSNKVVAAPVIWSRQVAKNGIVRAVVLNSGGANACTGPQGFIDTHRTAEHVAKLLDISSGEVVVCSTGLIGELLPMHKIVDGLDAIAPSMDNQGLHNSALAIMTTDSVPKIATKTLNGANFAGIAKGAGMLAPALATMLSVVMTDAVVTNNVQEIFARAADRTFNRIDSDGCTSTNDTVLFMSSGASGITISDEQLEEVLMNVCGSLAQQLIADAEGSTKSVAVQVINAFSEEDAVEIGRACARNNLLKAAIFGGDPNWGRVLAAVGTANAQMDPLTIDVKLNGVQVCTNSAPDADKSSVGFDAREVEIVIDLKFGTYSATIFTNDLSHDYVHENSAYST